MKWVKDSNFTKNWIKFIVTQTPTINSSGRFPYEGCLFGVVCLVFAVELLKVKLDLCAPTHHLYTWCPKTKYQAETGCAILGGSIELIIMKKSKKNDTKFLKLWAFIVQPKALVKLWSFFGYSSHFCHFRLFKVWSKQYFLDYNRK